MRAARQWRMMLQGRLVRLGVLILCSASVLSGCRATLPITVRFVTPTGVATPASTAAPARAEPTIDLPTPDTGPAR